MTGRQLTKHPNCVTVVTLPYSSYIVNCVAHCFNHCFKAKSIKCWEYHLSICSFFLFLNLFWIVQSGNYKHVKYLKGVLFNFCTLFECESSSQKQILSLYFHNTNIYSGTHLRGNNQQTFTDKLLETV